MQIHIQSKCFDDREMLFDALISQKTLTDTYNTYANECATNAVRDELMNILTEEHQIQQDVFTELQKRGWYKTDPADQQKVEQIKKEFGENA